MCIAPSSWPRSALEQLWRFLTPGQPLAARMAMVHEILGIRPPAGGTGKAAPAASMRRQEGGGVRAAGGPRDWRTLKRRPVSLVQGNPVLRRVSGWSAGKLEGAAGSRAAGSALAGLEARVGLVDHEHAALAPHHPAVLVALLGRLERVADLHAAPPQALRRRKLWKRRLNLSTWPPRSTMRERSPVHAGCTFGSISSVSLAPGSP